VVAGCGRGPTRPRPQRPGAHAFKAHPFMWYKERCLRRTKGASVTGGREPP